MHSLFCQDAVDDPMEEDGWWLGPIERLRLRGRTGARERHRLYGNGTVVLGPAEGTRLQALVASTSGRRRDCDRS